MFEIRKIRHVICGNREAIDTVESGLSRQVNFINRK